MNFISSSFLVINSYVFAIGFLIFLIAIFGFRQFKKLGHAGIYFGYVGLVLMFVMIVYAVVNLFIAPEAPAMIGPVIPGVSIPGSQIFVPFWYGIISIFIVAAFHEFGHGVIARSNNKKVLNTGFVLFDLAITP